MVHSFSFLIMTMQFARMVEMIAVEKRGWVSTEMAIRRMGLKGERKQLFAAQIKVARCLFLAFFCTLELDTSRSKSELLEVDLLAVENQS